MTTIRQYDRRCIYLQKEFHVKLKLEATRRNISIKELIEEILTDHYARKQAQVEK